MGKEDKLTQDSLAEPIEQLIRDDLRHPVEQSVSAYLGRTWEVRRVQDKRDSASHPAAILTDETYPVFIKLGEGALALDQFKQEVAGLQYLSQRSGVLTPLVIDIIQVGNQVLLVMEAVQEVKRERSQWRQMGQTLAQIHQVKGDCYGLETHCYWGSLYQDNTPLADWPQFFAERRLEPRLQAAVDSGNLPSDIVPQVEKLRAWLPFLCGPHREPTLLHGDAHQNNFLSTALGPVMIDPTVYYGHPEMDLAYVDFFAPVSAELFAAYQEITPLDPDFAARRNLWRIPAWLAMVQVDGPQHLPQLRAALQQYI
jgi:fructosamine-3-kinase